MLFLDVIFFRGPTLAPYRASSPWVHAGSRHNGTRSLPTLCPTLQDAHAVTRCARGCHSVCAGLDFTCFPRGAQTYTWKCEATIFTIFPLRMSSLPRAATTKRSKGIKIGRFENLKVFLEFHEIWGYFFRVALVLLWVARNRRRKLENLMKLRECLWIFKSSNFGAEIPFRCGDARERRHPETA